MSDQLPSRVDGTVAVRPSNTPVTPAPAGAIGFVVVHEVSRVVRWGIVAGAITFCVNVISNAVADVMKAAQPPSWQQVVIVSVTILGGLLLGQTPVLNSIWRFRAYIRSIGARNSQLEAMIDTTRSSSGLKEDGTHDLDT